MRKLIDIVENMSITPYEYGDPQPHCSFLGEVYHVSPYRFDEFTIDPDKGVYFANEPDMDYGGYVYRCRVTLRNACAEFSEDIISPYMDDYPNNDGRIVDYSNESDYEMFDVIAFDLSQITILEVIDKSR